jgi:hypothetical protein
MAGDVTAVPARVSKELRGLDTAFPEHGTPGRDLSY